MDRRQFFLRALGGLAAAAATAGIVVPPSTKRIFLPPSQGWPVPERAVHGPPTFVWEAPLSASSMFATDTAAPPRLDSHAVQWVSRGESGFTYVACQEEWLSCAAAAIREELDRKILSDIRASLLLSGA